MENAPSQAQKKIFRAVALLGLSDLYLVGGTALTFRFQHRVSEDLDFSTPVWSKTLHQKAARHITKETGFVGKIVNETTRRGLVKMAVYNFELGSKSRLKVDFVEDFDRLLHPVEKDGIASVDDLYLRKMRAAIGWAEKTSPTGRPMAGGRQASRDLFDLWYLSEHHSPMAEWFPQHFGRSEYARLAAWLRAMSTQAILLDLMDVAPGCDVRRIRHHLENQVYDRLNRIYIQP
jgi:hypothetical protein